MAQGAALVISTFDLNLFGGLRHNKHIIIIEVAKCVAADSQTNPNKQQSCMKVTAHRSSEPLIWTSILYRVHFFCIASPFF